MLHRGQRRPRRPLPPRRLGAAVDGASPELDFALAALVQLKRSRC